jgi:hypothetical protein
MERATTTGRKLTKVQKTNENFGFAQDNSTATDLVSRLVRFLYAKPEAAQVEL